MMPILLLSLAASLFFFGYPGFVMRPTRPQGAHELQLALWTSRYQHPAELICAAAALIALLFLLRAGVTRSRRIRALTFAGITVLFAGGSFVNIFEMLFHPAGAPLFQSAREARLDADEKILAVSTHAWPVRVLAYHHIVNDTEDGVPIAVTY